MKKLKIILILTVLIVPSLVLAADNNLAEKFKGKILLQVESYGRAWYVNPADGTRYYLKNGEEAYSLMKSLSLGISNKDLEKIPVQKNQPTDLKLINRLKGRILLQVEDRGQAWYVNPVDGLRYYLKDGQAAYQLMKEFALGISNADLRQIEMNSRQLTFDAAWDGVAYASLSENDEYIISSNGDLILPLASMTKLMTALVFLETDPDWQKTVTVTKAQINYPKELVGEDTTSEIDLAEGDKMRIDDLWVAMVVASSNQAAVILADSTGLSRGQFVERLNQKVKDLGLIKTLFFDVAGLDSHNVSTPKEFALIAKEAFSQEKIIWATEQTEYQINGFDVLNQPKTITVTDRNYSLRQLGIETAKTGFLVEAQRNVAFKKDGKIGVVMHARSMKERNDLIKIINTPNQE